MTEQPVRCPHSACPSRSGALFAYRRDGSFRRQVDGRVVQRFECLACGKGFSEQTLRVDYRLKRPELLPRQFLDRISKVTHRQSARTLGCSRSTEERHFRRLREHCSAFHDARLAEIAARGGLGRVFLLDELETFEHNRLEQPVTVPVLIERESGFVLDTRVGALPPRGKRGARKREQEPAAGSAPRRRSESRAKVKEAFERLRATCPKEGKITVRTDLKETYATLLRALFGERCEHQRTSSKQKRDTRNPLWPINHTLARMRDGVSRLVRRTWAASKLRRRLEGHLAIWVCYRNYVRGKTNGQPQVTPAMALGLDPARWEVERLLQRRILP
jgi:transposase-like protein